jgi:hypothetical protein
LSALFVLMRGAMPPPLNCAPSATTRRRFLQHIAAGTAILGLPDPGIAQSRQPQLYFSDYFSFVGRDDRGFVYLAHDNNRGRSGDDHQADHWIAMYDEATGWVDVKGSAHYPNPGRVLETIPDSQFFQFKGTSPTGIELASVQNDMRWKIGALSPVLKRESADGIFWIGAAPSTLVWNGRTLEGRVLFEYLQRHNWNRFTAGFGGGSFQNFNGLYLMTTDGKSDFYMHAHERKGGTDLTGRLVGCATWGKPAPVDNLEFRITESAAVPHRTTYRWPMAWRVGFDHAGKRYTLDLVTAERRLIADWENGGFAMSVVSGVITAIDGSTRMPVVGWAELII